MTPEPFDALPTGAGGTGQPDYTSVPFTPPAATPEPAVAAPPVAPAPIPQPAPSQGLTLDDGTVLTPAQAREALQYKENYNRWRSKLSNEAAQIHQMREQIRAEYGQWQDLAAGLSQFEDLNQRYLAEIQQRTGQAAPAAPTPGAPQPQGQAPQQPVPPEVAEMREKLRILEADHNARLVEQAEGQWNGVRDQWRRDFNTDMPFEVERDMRVLLHNNPGLSDLRLALAAAGKPYYDRKYQGTLGQQAQVASAAAQTTAGQMATGGTPGPAGPAQVDYATADLKDLIRQGRIAAGGTPDADYNPYASFGTGR